MTKVLIEVNELIDVPVIGGAGFMFRPELVPEETREYIATGLFEYALFVIGQRATAGKGDLTDSAKRALIMDKMQRLQDGTYRFGTGAREGDPIAQELRAMADEAARQAKWGLTASRSVAKEYGPMVAYAMAVLIAKGHCTASQPDYEAAKRVAEKNEESLLAKAKANVEARTMDIAL